MEELTNYLKIKDPLMEPYFILRDPYGYNLMVEIKSKSPGAKSREKFLGCYLNLGKCLNALVKDIGNYKTEYNSIQEYLKEWENLEERLKKLTNLNI